MDKNSAAALLKKLDQKDIPCFIYGESAYRLLTRNNANKVNFLTVVPVSDVEEYFKNQKCEIKTSEDTVIVKISNNTLIFTIVKNITREEFNKKYIATGLTVNSMLINEKGHVYDPYNGMDDIRSKTLKFIDGFQEKYDGLTYVNCIDYIFQDGFRYNRQILDYLRKHQKTLAERQRHEIILILCRYLQHTQNNYDKDMLKEILSIENIFIGFTPEYRKNIVKLIEMTSGIGLSMLINLLLYFAKIDVTKKQNIFSEYINIENYKSFSKIVSEQLQVKNVYMKHKNENQYSFMSYVIEAQKIIFALREKEYTVPVYHLFSTMNEVAEWVEPTNLIISDNKQHKGEIFDINNDIKNIKNGGNCNSINASLVLEDDVPLSEEVSNEYDENDNDTDESMELSDDQANQLLDELNGNKSVPYIESSNPEQELEIKDEKSAEETKAPENKKTAVPQNNKNNNVQNQKQPLKSIDVKNQNSNKNNANNKVNESKKNVASSQNKTFAQNMQKNFAGTVLNKNKSTSGQETDNKEGVD